MRVNDNLLKKLVVISIIITLMFSLTGCQAIKGTVFDVYYAKLLSFFGTVDRSDSESTARAFLKSIQDKDKEKALSLISEKHKGKFDYDIFMGTIENTNLLKVEKLEKIPLFNKKVNEEAKSPEVVMLEFQSGNDYVTMYIVKYENDWGIESVTAWTMDSSEDD